MHALGGRSFPARASRDGCLSGKPRHTPRPLCTAPRPLRGAHPARPGSAVTAHHQALFWESRSRSMCAACLGAVGRPLSRYKPHFDQTLLRPWPPFANTHGCPGHSHGRPGTAHWHQPARYTPLRSIPCMQACQWEAGKHAIPPRDIAFCAALQLGRGSPSGRLQVRGQEHLPMPVGRGQSRALAHEIRTGPNLVPSAAPRAAPCLRFLGRHAGLGH